MDFRLLGSLEVGPDSTPLPLGGPRQRALLALLLLHANDPVPRDRLIDDLWGEAPPPTARETVNVYVSRLRKVLGGNGLGDLVRRGNSYILVVDPNSVDLLRFEHLAQEGRHALAAGDAADAARILGEALTLWRGPPLADLDSEPFVLGERRRLDELHLTTIESRVDADLALGRHADVVPELEALVAEHPYREQLWAQLLVAFYRSGRQADALDAYRRARRILSTELGIEPGPALRELERKILAQDPGLGPPAAAAARRSRRRTLSLAAAVTAAAAAALVAAWVVRDAEEGTTLVRLTPNSVGAIDVQTNELVARFATGDPPRSIAVGAGGVWVAKEFQHTIRRIDLDTGRRTEIGLANAPRQVAVGYGRVWVVGFDTLTAIPAATLVAIDPGTRSIGRSLELRGTWKPSPNRRAKATPPGVAVGAGSVWVRSSNTVWRIDPSSFRVVATIRLPEVAYALAVGEGSAWVVAGARLFRIDTRSNAPVAITSGQSSSQWGLAVGAGSVWITDYSDDSLRRIDPVSGRTTRLITLADGPRDVVVAGDSVWVASDRTVMRIDPTTSRVVKTISLGQYVQALASENERVWVAGIPNG